jgi:hypothetical protein
MAVRANLNTKLTRVCVCLWERAGETFFLLSTFGSADRPLETQVGMWLMLVLWAVAPCGLVGRYKLFGGTYCLYLQLWRYNPEDQHRHLHRREILKLSNWYKCQTIEYHLYIVAFENPMVPILLVWGFFDVNKKIRVPSNQ